MKVITTYKGKFLLVNVAQKIETNTRRMLRNVGEDVSRKMRDTAERNDFSGRLSDSITWRTSYEDGAMGSNAEKSDMIARPTIRNSVDIGTANPYAYVREFGAGPHISPQGSEEFIAALKDWFREKIGEDPDGEASYRFWLLVDKIREGQDAVPFVAPHVIDFIKMAARESRYAGFERSL